ncbi:putative helicase MOV-10 [Hypsizygus marmoreus]|uniref:RNA helicase n=1 Tax=Hypsizygus marmoreus TaxID=39966 RepID=A0A369K743_HYPMA|nr:putative helicase MOV-10 [Hypsizygus marmoreus]
MVALAICPRLHAEGSCQDPQCGLNHVMLTCDPCGFMCASAAEMEEHTNSRIHQNKVKGTSIFFRCSVCGTRTIGRQGWNAHVHSRKHLQKTQQAGVDPNIIPEEPDQIPKHTYCVSCSVHIQDAYWDRHLKGEKHLEKERFAAFKVVLDETEKDKHGISVAADFDFGIVDLPEATNGKVLNGTISTSIPLSRIMLVDIKITSVTGATPARSTFRVGTLGACMIKVSQSLTFSVTFCQNYAGRCQDRLELVFEDTQLKTRFTIARPLFGIVGNKADHERLRPVAPYVPRKKSARQPELMVVEGIRPPALKAVPYVVPLPRAAIPGGLATTLSTGSPANILSRVQSVFLPPELNTQGYARHFKHLLWIEEFRMEKDLEIYDMTNANLTQHGNLYYLDVPGLAEKRPSVLVGDRILVQQRGAQEGHWFEGGVHVVRKEEVGLRFNASFRGWTRDQRYNVRFKLNRYPVRRQHQALDTAFSEERVLFPEGVHVPRGPYPKQADVRLRVINPLIATNPPQLQAVISIVKQAPGAAPFVIFGPPGTGKTITMVEAIKQVLRANPNARILACAPSNSAADLIAQRLSDLNTNELFRFYAPSRVKDMVPDSLLPYTHARPDGHFSVPPMARMMRFKVIVTTCVSASVVSGIGIPRGHYSHIFVDEAGQATEPEAFIAIKTMANSNTNVILSGDPKQLGPIIRSDIACKLGLETSYIERLMKRDAYDVRRGYGITVVKLVKNFRSHNTILKFPNERFYEGELEQCGDKKTINAFLGSSYLPNKDFPIVFHGLCGKDDREASSPSFFNIDEVLQVKSYVEHLRADRRFRTTDNDIGVITPYNAQCRKIRTALRGVADSVKVGSVEEFQGQERPVIIISTVRSSTEFVEYDLRHTLGFVANPRRFNVSVTRAKALLIVIGDPSVLSLDPLWRSFLNYIHNNRGWTGSPITWDPNAPVDEAGGYDRQIREAAKLDMNDFARRMEQLTLAGVEATEDGGNVDRPWRDVE